MRLRTTLVMLTLVGIGLAGLAYGVERASATITHTRHADAAQAPAKAQAPVADAPAASTPHRLSVDGTRPPRADMSKRVRPAKPELTPGPRLLGRGSAGDQVRDLQARLKQIGWYFGEVTGTYADQTTLAVRGFQKKRKIPVTGEVDRRTLDRLRAMTRQPSYNELHNIVPPPPAGSRIDPRCMSGRVLCIDKSANTLRWIVDGQVRSTFAVRFGSSTTPTREGSFSVYAKSRNHVSKLYGSSMPFAMFFSGGQAVHYSSDFAARGYAGASHGCVNVRDYNGIAALFDTVAIGDRVIVYRS